MLNGKFFTGLPPKMIDRGTPRPDRQKSNFFWPDESDESPGSPSPRKSQSSLKTTQKDQRITPNTEEITPKNLYHKQLKSKIEFYDTVDSSPADNKRSQFIEKKNKEPNKERLNNRYV